jgi:hypothetical protein
MNDPVQEQLEAYNARDVDRFVACYADHVEIVGPTGEVMLRGTEALRATYASLFAAQPELHARVATRLRAGAFVVDDEWVTGMRGGSGETHAIAVYEVRDGRIVHVRFLA